jgi:hypothetical protein
MAVTTVTTSMAAGVNYTRVTDTSADWASVPNSTYFYDKADKLVHYKDSTGVIQEIFSAPGGITVGTTAVTSGTDGRVFFQAGGVVQQDANFTYDNTLKRLGLKAVNTGAGDIPFNVQNSAGTANLIEIAGNNTMTFLSTTGKAIFSSSGSGANLSMRRDFSSEEMIKINAGDFPFIEVKPINTTSHIAVGTLANGASTWWDGVNYNFQIKNSFHNLFHVVGNPNSALATFRLGTIASNTNFFNIHGRNTLGTGLTTNPIFTINSSGTVGIGTEASTPGARLDVRAADGLSNPVFRIRNSNDTGNLLTSLGSAQIIFGTSTTTPDGQILVRHDFGSAQPILTLRNGQFGNLIFQVRDERTSGSFSTGSIRINGIINGGESGTTKRFDLGGHGLGTSYGDSVSNAVWENNQGNVGDGQGTSVISVSSNFYINRQTVKVFKFMPNVGNFGVNVMTFGTSATNTIAIANGVAPTTSPADAFQQYSADATTDNAAPHFRTENGSIIKLYQEAAVTTSQGIATALASQGLLATSTIVPTVQSVVSAATVTPVAGNEEVVITAQAAALTIANPTGTWYQGQDLIIRIKDDGTGRAITWDTNYRAIGVTLPTTTVANKLTYVGVIYNSTDSKWDVLGVSQEA